MKIKLLLLHGGQQMIHHWYKRQIDAGHLQLPSARQQSGVKACAAMLIFAPLLIPDLTFSKKCYSLLWLCAIVPLLKKILFPDRLNPPNFTELFPTVFRKFYKASTE
jgi:hypothetical protein